MVAVSDKHTWWWGPGEALTLLPAYITQWWAGLSHKSLWSPNSLPPAIPCSNPDLCHALGSGADPVNVLGPRENRKKDFHTEHTTSPGACGIFIREKLPQSIWPSYESWLRSEPGREHLTQHLCFWKTCRGQKRSLGPSELEPGLTGICQTLVLGSKLRSGPRDWAESTVDHWAISAVQDAFFSFLEQL